MELLQLEYFRAVAHAQHVTETANLWNVSQSSVSRTIQRLEEDLGVALFDRVGRTLRLNEDGRIFLQRVENALRELELGTSEIRDRKEGRKSCIRLAANTAILVPAILGQLRKQHPEIRMHVRTVSFVEMLDLIRKGDADFGLTTSEVALETFEREILLRDRLFLVVPSGHVLAMRVAFDWAELSEQNFVGLKPGYGTRDLTDVLCRSAGFTPRYVYEGDDPTRLIALVEAEVGIAFVPGISRRKAAGVHYIELPDERFTREVSLIRRKGIEKNEASEAFCALVKNCFDLYRTSWNSTALENGGR